MRTAFCSSVALLCGAASAQTFTGLSRLPQGETSQAQGLSGDGAVVVGSASSNGAVLERAVRWTSGSGLQNLGVLTSADSDSWANGANADGSVVVGYCLF